MAIRLGTNPIAWSNDDMPALGGDTPLETCLREARQAGFEGIELGNKFPHTAAALRPILDAHGLVLVSGWYGSRLLERSVEGEIAAMAEHLDLMTAMGCPVMVFAEVSNAVHGNKTKPVAHRPRLARTDWRPYCDKLTAVADHLADRGVRLAYHHHMGTVVQAEDEIDHLMQDTGPSVGLLFDTGHLAFAGVDVAAVAERHADRIVHVHAKDVRGEVMRRQLDGYGSFLDAVVDGVFTVPDDGDIDFEAALAPLYEANYDGWMIVEAEQDPAKADPLTYATKGYRALDAVVRRLGFTVAA